MDIQKTDLLTRFTICIFAKSEITMNCILGII